MKRASAFTSALSASRSYRVRDGRLELLGSDGAVLAAFAAQLQALAGTAWRATGINSGRGGVASPVSGSMVTMRFEVDGQVGGSAGCNRFNARYVATGPNLRITAPATTRKMCETSLMEQEQAFLKALESVATMRFEADRLELRTQAGALAVTLSREPGS
jgi:heat shock protein HslJ